MIEELISKCESYRLGHCKVSGLHAASAVKIESLDSSGPQLAFGNAFVIAR